MSGIKGLAAIRKNQQEIKERQEAMNRPKAEWFKWPKGTSVATVRFLQELDENAANFNADRGLGFIQVEHQAPGPDGYKRRANCTSEDEGACYACERHQLDVKEGWRQRQNLYINALVQFEGQKEVNVVVIQRNANSSFVQALIEEAVDENTITDKNFKITRVGEGTTTQWLLKGLKGDPFDDKDAEVFDLDETAIRDIAYDKQAAYYGAVYQNTEAVEGGVPAQGKPAVPADAEW